MNNRINPLYIVLLLIVLVFVSYSLVQKEMTTNNMINKQVLIIQEKAAMYNEYKANWYNKSKVLSEVNSILKSSSFRNKKQLKVESKNAIKIKLEASDPKVLGKFMNKFLNKKFLINKLEVNKNFVFIEIGFK